MSLIYELDLMTLVVLMMYQYLHIKNELSESRLLKVEALQTPRSDRGPCKPHSCMVKMKHVYGQISRHPVNISKLEVESDVSR